MTASNLNTELLSIFNTIKNIDEDDWNLKPHIANNRFHLLKISSHEDNVTKLHKTYIGFNNDPDIHIIKKFIGNNLVINLDYSMFKLLYMFDLCFRLKEVIWEYFFDLIKYCRLNNLINKIVKEVNNISWFPGTDINTNPKTLKDWNILIKYFEYEPNCFFSPSRIFDPFFPYPKNRILSIIITDLNDISYAALLAHGIQPSSIIEESKYLNSLICSDYLRPFLLLYYQNYDTMKNLPHELYTSLIEKYWDNAGIEFFKLAYGNTNSYDQKFHIECLENKLNLFIVNHLIERDVSFFDHFSWYKDYQAFAGYYLEKGKSCPTFSDNYELIMKAISNNLLKQWKKCNMNSLYNDSSIYNYKPYDLLHPKNTLAMSLISNSIFSDTESFHQWLKILKKILLVIKPHLYSEYEVTFKSCNLIQFILLVHLSIINIKETNNIILDNLKEGLKLIQEDVLYPYLAIVELNDDVWNPDRVLTFKKFNDKDIFLINEYIIEICKTTNIELKNAFSNFLTTWKKLSSTKWKWFDFCDNGK